MNQAVRGTRVGRWTACSSLEVVDIERLARSGHDAWSLRLELVSGLAGEGGRASAWMKALLP